MESPHLPASPTLRPWRDQMRAISRSVGAFLVGSEDAFLDTGARVEGLQQAAQAILGSARAAAALEPEAGSDEPAARLDRELNRLDEYLRATRESSQAASLGLEQLLAHVGAVVRAHAQLESIPPTLDMLGLNTRIENARPGVRNAGMEAVAAEVRRLADRIETSFRAVFSQASALNETAGVARVAADAFLQRQGARSSEMLRETRGALDSLRTLGRAHAAIAGRAVVTSDLLAQELAAVLVALQGHDATRQVLEHVQQALDAWETEAAAAERAGELDAGPWLGHLGELCRVLSAQVGGAHERFTTALRAISEHLRSLSRRGAELERDAGRCLPGGEESPVERVASGVERATRSLRAHLEQEQATHRAMRRVVELVGDMDGSVRDIEGIGAAVKLIALNALVETERSGRHGRVLAVLAQAMGGLAAEVVQHTGQVSHLLGQIAGLASSLAGSASLGDGLQGEAIASSLEDLARRLSDAHGRLQGAVDSLHHGTRALSDEVEGIADRISRQLAGAHRLQDIAAHLEQVGAEIARSASPRAGPGLGGSWDPLYSRYTMQTERTIHHRVLRGPTPAAGAEPALPSSPLGANVELF